MRTVATLDHRARERYRKTVLALAVGWVLDEPGVQIALWRARSPEQLDVLDEVGVREARRLCVSPVLGAT